MKTRLAAIVDEMDTIEESLEQAKDRWNAYFDSALHALIDYEMSAEDCVNAVEKAAIVADAALNAYEARWGRSK